MTLYEYPNIAALDRFLPKSKVFEFAKPTTRIKKLFAQQVDKITIAYSLSSRSVNLAATESVKEIQIFNIVLKNEELNLDILQCIDKAISFPIIFELSYAENVKIIACLKRPSEADFTKWVISDYFESKWLNKSVVRTPLPIALDLGRLYESILMPLIPYEIRKNENIQDYVERICTVKAKEKELKRLEVKLKNENQFNKKVEINTILKNIQNDIENLTL